MKKTEAVLITDRRIFRPPVLSLVGNEVALKRSFNCLGVLLDGRLLSTNQNYGGKSNDDCTSPRPDYPNDTQSTRIEETTTKQCYIFVVIVWKGNLDND